MLTEESQDPFHAMSVQNTGRDRWFGQALHTLLSVYLRTGVWEHACSNVWLFTATCVPFRLNSTTFTYVSFNLFNR